jgi:1,4-alpha-glucan branching enzyme
MSIYEVHLGSWKRKEENQLMTYRELAEQLVPYVKEMGFTHVEFMPVMEHPYDLSWGYQVTGFYAPTSRFGTPQDFKYLVESFHKADIGVILDWVPSHFPSDAHGLAKFDGTYVYENPDRRKGYHPDWDSMIFNYDRPEIRSFLISNAFFWAKEYRIDGFRVDAVASMLYLDYSREEGEWEPNVHGGNHNLSAIKFLKDLNEYLYGQFPDIHLIAEESTSFDGVTRAVHEGGLGFGFKWMMGWMNDTLDYFSKDPIHRKHHQGQITFSMIYAFSENYVLPLSHDEVVHGKKSLIYKMPGDEWQKFSNLRLLFAYMYTHPGAKLIFMGSEFGQTNEWNCTTELDWHLLKYDPHQGIQHLIKHLNQLYSTETALHQINYNPDGFEWIDIEDHDNSIIIYLRKGKKSSDQLLVICNFTPVPQTDYKIGVEKSGNWELILNTDDKKYGGSAFKVKKKYKTKSLPQHGKTMSLLATLPPLAMIILKHKGS